MVVKIQVFGGWKGTPFKEVVLGKYHDVNKTLDNDDAGYFLIDQNEISTHEQYILHG